MNYTGRLWHKYCHLILIVIAWDGGAAQAVKQVHENQYFLCQKRHISLSYRERKHDSIICSGIRQSLDMSCGQTEQMIDKPPRVNGASIPLNLYEVWSLLGVFLFHCFFLFAEIADVLIWFSSVCLTKLSVRFADMAPVQFPTRHSCLFPFDRGCASSPHFWSQFTGRQPIHVLWDSC